MEKDKKYDHFVSEAQLRTQWQARHIYKKNAQATYSVDTPPPTVSGSLHIGHIFSYTHTDILVRYHRMSGEQVYYPFGFDDNGLPTEKFVEKKRAILAHQFKRSEFINICLEETHQIEEQFKDLWQKIGLSVDWDYCYSTISPLVRKISQESFIRLFKKGFVYRTYEPALYCPVCRTSVAQAELDDAIKPSHFVTITFKSEDKDLLVATTRPELLAACGAVLYHPEDERYKNLAGKKVQVPLYYFEVPLLADESVIKDKGTGLVMVCTFGDKTDIAWFKKFNLTYKQAIGFDGKMTAITGPLAGLKVNAARTTVIELLQQAGLVTEVKALEHAVNVHERCKNEIEYVMLSQWFLRIMPYKQQLIEIADTINWYPAFMKARYKNWVENISWDWCLSRQRFFGIPFPAWHCVCGEIILADIATLPIDPQEQRAPSACTACGSQELTADSDVMDTWNTSSLTPYICIALERGTTEGLFEVKPHELPMSMRPQAHDIIRTWAFYTIIKTWMHHDSIPWNDIVISGHVLSTEKEKISKSQGNSPLQPENLLAAYPADAIRYWTASGSLGQDVPFSENQLKIGQKLITKLWNAYKFVGEHCAESSLIEQPVTLGVNRWILHQAGATFKRYKAYLEENEFGLALQTVEQFFWHEFCDNYLEFIKDALFNPQNYKAQDVQEIKAVLYSVGLRILQLYAPYMPFITDTLYLEYYEQKIGKASLHLTTYADRENLYEHAQEAQAFGYVKELVSAVRKLKSDHKLSLKTDIAQLTVSADTQVLEQLKSQELLLKGVTRAQAIIYQPSAHTQTELQQVDTVYHATVVL